MMARRPRFPRPSLVMLPNAFTLANLFFGMFAIVSAARGDHNFAAGCIVAGAFCDMLDGRIARATNTFSAFGEELDSLVDAISFGLAPAMMMYFAVLRHTGWDWLFCFIFTASAVMRLARFNVETGGSKKKIPWFKGLPSPAAGGTLATYYWFSQTPIYNDVFVGWPWEVIMRALMLVLAALMISDVPFPGWPKLTFKTLHGSAAIVVLVSTLVAIPLVPKHYFFPVGVGYMITGILLVLVRTMFEMPPIFGDPSDDADDDELPTEGAST